MYRLASFGQSNRLKQMDDYGIEDTLSPEIEILKQDADHIKFILSKCPLYIVIFHSSQYD